MDIGPSASLIEARTCEDVMRYGIISDIHGNLHALRGALEVLKRNGVDAYLCPGDLVGYGPMPNECVEIVAGLDAACVAGNHDLMVLGRLPSERCFPLVRKSVAWTRGVLRDDARNYLAQLDVVLSAEPGVMTHASLDDPTRYIREPREAAEQLAVLEVHHPSASTLLLGHTHKAWAYDQTEGSLPVTAGTPVLLRNRSRRLINPGSVGQSRDREPWAHFMILDTDRNEIVPFAIDYDVDACRRALSRHGLPLESCHRPPLSVFDKGKRVLRRASRKARLRRMDFDTHSLPPDTEPARQHPDGSSSARNGEPC